MIVAVPALVTCAVASTWISVQYAAEASQKFTWPALIVPEVDVTAAVSAIVVPVVMFVALPEVAVTVNVVVVTGAAAAVAVKLIANVIAKTPVHAVASGAAKYRSNNPRRKKFPLQRRSIVRPLSDGSYNSVRDEKVNGPKFAG